MTIVPLSFSHWHLIAILREQGFLIRGVSVRALPAGDLHEVTAQCNFTFVEWANTHAARCREWLTRVYRRCVNLLR